MSRITVMCGLKGSGKSEAAKTLQTSYGHKLIKLADPLKDMVGVLLKYLDISDFAIEEYLNGSLKETPVRSLGKSPRHLMQTLGTDWAREMVHPDVWVSIARDRIKDLVNSRNDVVIDDIRFPNELDMVREFSDSHDVTVVWVHNVNVIGGDTHPSETSIGQSDCDVTIRSDELKKFRADVSEFGRNGEFPEDIIITQMLNEEEKLLCLNL